MAPDADPNVGVLLEGRYQVVQSLGEGAMGVVYYGFDKIDERPVAVKMLSDEAIIAYGDEERLIERFKREIETTRKLKHPNIVQVLADGEVAPGKPYVVLEFLEGWDLRDVLDDETKLTPERAARVGLSVALALAESHSHKIVHRDLKPENIFLVRREGTETVKVLDFGIARGTEEEGERLTMAGTALGTPRYMAPEQVTDELLAPATDLYSLGIVMFEMLSGELPFWTENELDLALMHVHAAPAKLDVEGMEVELLSRWRRLVERLLQKDPQRRPDAAEVASELATLHALALMNEEVDPDKDTQILRVVQPGQAMPSPDTDTARPTRVLGVRTTYSGASRATPTRINPALSPQSVKTELHAAAARHANQRATTDQVAEPQRAELEGIARSQRLKTDTAEDPRRAKTDTVAAPPGVALGGTGPVDDQADGPQRAKTDTVSDLSRAATRQVESPLGERSSRSETAMTPLAGGGDRVHHGDDAERKATLWTGALVLTAIVCASLYFILS